MHHPKLLRSRWARFVMIPVALLCVVVSGCADQQPPTAPLLPSVTRTSNVPFNKFFTAWSQSYSSAPIQTQIFALDARQDRQFVNWYVDQQVLSFARANPGRLYIDGDEPDQYCVAPSEYAGTYRDFVTALRAADPTARFSPAGFAEPNVKCCPEGDKACYSRMHSISYADQFYKAYVQRYGVAPPVDEWRFDDFGVSFEVGDMDGWWARIDAEAAWSVSHGANMALGGWGFHGWPARESVQAFQEHLKQAMGRLINDKRINGAAYWSYEPWIESPRPLATSDGNLTTEGQTYANPLTDVPTSVKIVGSENGRAKLRWSNTTAAWAAEAEFWVQASGSGSFVYRSTELVAGPGATQTAFAVFNTADNVKGRVRYYNAFGQAAWSPFSNTISGVSRKSPAFCLLQSC